MMFFTRKKDWRLDGAKLRECVGNVPGPGRGWYRIYSYALGEELELPPVRYEGETLALVMIDIGAFRDRDIDGDGLAEIRRILSAFADLGMEMLVRIVYDTQGKGMEREPAFFAQVLAHIGQAGALLAEYAEHILLFQGLFVGSWGEMHSSKFLTEKYLRQMTDCFLEATEGKVRLAFRTPVLLRKVVKEGEAIPNEIGFFDDALIADETHMGTFGILPREQAGWTQAWRAEDEVVFMDETISRVPFGGEALSGTEELSAEETIAQLTKFHVSYLNCMHDAACLARWRELSAAPGVSLYDYVGEHLGYRFVVESASLVRKGKGYCLRVQIANRGFACYPAELRLALCAGKRELASVLLHPQELAGGGQGEWEIALPEEELSEGVQLSLRLTAAKRGKILPFANEGAGECLPLGMPVRGFDGQ